MGRVEAFGVEGVDHLDDAVIAAYAAAAFVFRVVVRPFGRVRLVLALGVALFALAAVSDAVPTEALAPVEELAELAGAALLAAGFALLCAGHVGRALAVPAAARARPPVRPRAPGRPVVPA